MGIKESLQKLEPSRRAYVKQQFRRYDEGIGWHAYHRSYFEQMGHEAKDRGDIRQADKYFKQAHKYGRDYHRAVEKFTGPSVPPEQLRRDKLREQQAREKAIAKQTKAEPPNKKGTIRVQESERLKKVKKQIADIEQGRAVFDKSRYTRERVLSRLYREQSLLEKQQVLKVAKSRWEKTTGPKKQTYDLFIGDTKATITYPRSAEYVGIQQKRMDVLAEKIAVKQAPAVEKKVAEDYKPTTGGMISEYKPTSFVENISFKTQSFAKEHKGTVGATLGVGALTGFKFGVGAVESFKQVIFHFPSTVKSIAWDLPRDIITGDFGKYDMSSLKGDPTELGRVMGQVYGGAKAFKVIQIGGLKVKDLGIKYSFKTPLGKHIPKKWVIKTGKVTTGVDTKIKYGKQTKNIKGRITETEGGAIKSKISQKVLKTKVKDFWKTTQKPKKVIDENLAGKYRIIQDKTGHPAIQKAGYGWVTIKKGVSPLVGRLAGRGFRVRGGALQKYAITKYTDVGQTGKLPGGYRYATRGGELLKQQYQPARIRSYIDKPTPFRAKGQCIEKFTKTRRGKKITTIKKIKKLDVKIDPKEFKQTRKGEYTFLEKKGKGPGVKLRYDVEQLKAGYLDIGKIEKPVDIFSKKLYGSFTPVPVTETILTPAKIKGPVLKVITTPPSTVPGTFFPKLDYPSGELQTPTRDIMKDSGGGLIEAGDLGKEFDPGYKPIIDVDKPAREKERITPIPKIGGGLDVINEMDNVIRYKPKPIIEIKPDIRRTPDITIVPDTGFRFDRDHIKTKITDDPIITPKTGFYFPFEDKKRVKSTKHQHFGKMGGFAGLIDIMPRADFLSVTLTELKLGQKAIHPYPTKKRKKEYLEFQKGKQFFPTVQMEKGLL